MTIATTKIVTGTLLTGIIGGGIGTGIYLLNNYTTIKDKLTSEGFSTVVREDEWTAILNAHNADNSTNVFKLNTNEEKNVSWLKKKCNEALNKKDDTNYKSARQWCVKTEAISDILKNGKFKVLNNVDSKTDDKNDWIIKLTNLSKSNKAKEKITITWTKAVDEQIKEIKAKCKEMTDLKNIDKTFDEKFVLAKNWCAIKAS